MKSILLFAASALAAVTIQAKVVTTQQAQSLAKQFRQTQAARSGIASTLAETDMKLAYAPQGSEYYVFNGAGNTGYVIVSGDDCAPAVLGYGNTGSFDISNIPPAMKAWLDLYAKQVVASAKSGIKYTASTTADHEKIEPLMTTKWDQSSPYNDLCPFDETQRKRAYSGCVATAMAQVANYHKWPVQAKGIGKATFNQSPVERDMNSDVFDWNNMLDKYAKDTGNDSQRAAVALLMVDMGYSVGMKYSVQGSNAYPSYISGALIDHFDYDKATHIEYKDWYSDTEWDNIIYNELANKRPIVMGGSAAKGGHAFVCDGYAGGGYYHFNWGWGGEFDANFLLSALNPGGSNPYYQFNSNVDAIIGVQKPQEESDYVWQFGNWSTIHTSVNPKTNEVSIVANMCNFSAKPFSGQIGLKVVNATTNEVTYKSAVNTENMKVSWKVDSIPDTLLSGLPDGVYKISTAFKPNDGEWTECRYLANLDHEKELKLTVEGGKRSYAVDAPLKIISKEMHNFALIKNRSTEFTLSMTTNGAKTNRNIYYTIVDNTTNSSLHTSEKQPLEIDTDKSSPNIKFSIPAINDIDTTHVYNVCFFIGDDEYPMHSQLVKAIDPNIEILEPLTVTNLKNGYLFDETANISMKVLNKSKTPFFGFYANMTGEKLEDSESELIKAEDRCKISGDTILLNGYCIDMFGAEGEVTIKMEFCIQEGISIPISPSDKAQVTFKISDPSGIQGTKDTAATAVTTEVYNMQGMRLTQHSGNANISGLPSGFYIVKTTDNIGNTKTSKVMVK